MADCKFDDNSGESVGHLIEDGVFVGSIEAARNVGWLEQHSITHLLSLTCKRTIWPDAKPTCIVQHVHIRVDDWGWLAAEGSGVDSDDEDADPTQREFWRHLDRCFDVLQSAREAKVVILVHCDAGINRSVSTVIAWLMLRHDINYKKALERVRAKHPCANPSEHMRDQVLRYFADLDDVVVPESDHEAVDVPELVLETYTVYIAVMAAGDTKGEFIY